MKNSIRLFGIKRHSLVNGKGVRYVIFTQGCPHHCIGCQNPDSHNFNAGYEQKVDDIIQEIIKDRNIDGITLSGGEPFLQAEPCCKIAEIARKKNLSVWAYTGFIYEDIVAGVAGNMATTLLKYIDVLVDGPFDQNKLSETCKWRGSTNQRLIDVQATLKNKSGSIVEYSDC